MSATRYELKYESIGGARSLPSRAGSYYGRVLEGVFGRFPIELHESSLSVLQALAVMEGEATGIDFRDLVFGQLCKAIDTQGSIRVWAEY